MDYDDGTAPLIPAITLGEIELDILSRQVRAGKSVVHLSGIEQSLIYLLASRAGCVVTLEEILGAVWGTDFVAESNIVDRHVRSLRIKLQDGYWHQAAALIGARVLDDEPAPIAAQGSGHMADGATWPRLALTLAAASERLANERHRERERHFRNQGICTRPGDGRGLGCPTDSFGSDA